MPNPSLGPSRRAELPAEANLEHLRKAAKLRLKAMREPAPSTKLSDAQFQIAREYGFGSWRALKAEIDRRRTASGAAPPMPVQSGPPDPALEIYARPQRLVKLNTRRRLNVCVMGHGSPTVVLAAGLNASTSHWARVQPEMAKRTLTVSFDKAGRGFSDAGPLPRSAAATVADLRTALAEIGARPPYVLVGHSLGGLEMRLFAFLHTSEVAGLVLVDSTSEAYTAKLFGLKAMRDWSRRDYAEVRRTAAMARAGTLLPGTVEYDKRVYFPPDPELPDALNAAILQNRASPGYWRAQLSVIREQLGGDQVALAESRRSLGDMPIVVLTAAETLAAGGDDKLSGLVQSTQADMAALSSRGVHRIVDCGHHIPWERAGAVVSAIEEVLGQVRMS
jgi:pimeloyl-ACP methyl ester carboxylesterase